MKMSYELNAETANGVHDTTLVQALDSFNIPEQRTGGDGAGSTGFPPAKAVWVTDASALSADPPQFGPVDAIWSIGGNGGGNGVVGVAGVGGYAGVIGTASPDETADAPGVLGVIGYGSNGVAGICPNPSGMAVVGQNGAGTAVVGWAVPGGLLLSNTIFSPESGPVPGGKGPAPRTLPGRQIVGVYGCVGEALVPSHHNVQAGVWGDTTDKYGPSAAAPGVRGTSSNGTGVAGDSTKGLGGVFTSSGSAPGVEGKSSGAEGGVFQSGSSAQIRLIPSDSPLDANNPLMQTGQTGQLYLYSHTEYFLGTDESNTKTILWLCVAPAPAGGQATWAQVQLGDLIGG
jgi:hypothetical protein